ncbi:MAG: excinuclease ABC subunit UvrA [bacterium]|nr:excinuclease ABC subunit UvrA [bacterium]
MICIRGAREHNLKSIDVDIPHHKLVVITGLSGSGKSSLAFDTLFAEGQRRFVESLSAYARQFLGLMQKPRVDQITGLSPAIAIEQRSTATGLRSTVGTATEIYDYVRLLYAHVGVAHCPACGAAIQPQTTDEIIHAIETLPAGTRIELLAPIVRGQKGEHQEVFERARRSGFVRVRVDGRTFALDDVPALARTFRHTVEIVIDRVVVKEGVRERLAESVETALRLADGRVIVARPDDRHPPPTNHWTPLQPGDLLFSKAYACPHCETSSDFEPLTPRLFSFNSPYGACPACHGLGASFADLATPCAACQGARLNPYSRAVRVNGLTVIALTALSVDACFAFLEALDLRAAERAIVGDVLKEIRSRLTFLRNVGLGYLTLARKADSLSGGEAQRIRLASQIGTGLTGVLYVLDEPTIGLHPRDNEKLLTTLEALRDLGNTVVLVEHDAETMLRADYIIDLGPGAGAQGGQVVFQGPVPALLRHPTSLTAAYLTGACAIALPPRRRTPARGQQLVFTGVTHNNLKNITVAFPLGVFTCVTGVSGSGKSSLVIDTVLPALRQALHQSTDPCGAHKAVRGIALIDKVIVVDQSPIGRTPRSNPATYTGMFTLIRDLFTKLPDARMRGYLPGRFSFNVEGGRCEACQGTGIKQIEMHFLPDVYVVCEACQGRRYNRETLDVRYRGKNIAEVLDMTVEEAYTFFARVPRLRKVLQTLRDVGLEYITLGQHATTVSGGEAQRVKLSGELAKRDTGRTLYVLDEPTTGLHFADVDKLLAVLQRLVAAGNTVIVIEHNLDVIMSADHIIDLGPGGGEAGGRVIATGTPEQVAGVAASATGQFIAPRLARTHPAAASAGQEHSHEK